MKNIYGGLLTILLLGIVFVPTVKAETVAVTTTSSASVNLMLEQIKVLMAKVAELQKQLSTIQGEVKAVLKTGLHEGMTDGDIKKIQELLATDSTLYPEGKTTGYFGPLTKDAVKRFQVRHELAGTGVIDEETRDLLEEYLHESFGDRIPPGLLKAPGIMKKVEDRYRLGCKVHGHGEGPLCKKLHQNDNDDQDDNEEEFDVEVEIEDGETTVSFSFSKKDYDVRVDSTDLDEVLDAVADVIKDGDTAEDLDKDLSEAIEKEFNDADKANDHLFDVEIEIEDGTTTVSFTFEDEDYEVEVKSTDIDAILNAVADAIDEGDDRNDLDRNLKVIIKESFKKAEYASNIAEREAEKDADRALESAEQAITDAQESIDADGGDTTEAKKLLAKAKNALNDAEDAFNDEDFDEAEDLAEDAEDLADDAKDAL